MPAGALDLDRADGASPVTIAPYGGELVDRRVTGERAGALRREAGELPTVRLSARVLSDLYLIAVGALSPLRGFMGRADYESVLEEMTLAGDGSPSSRADGGPSGADVGPSRAGLPWSVPIVLPATGEEAAALAPGGRAALIASDGEIAGVIEVEEVHDRQLAREARAVYGTEETEHPGVAALHGLGPKYVAGPVHYLHEEDVSGFPGANRTPAEVRGAIREQGWRRVVGFQTRNPIHRAHEYIMKCALELVDGLLVHPLVGETKEGDVPAGVRMECYRAVLEHHFPSDRAMLSVLPAAMRYAGPREAIHHAIMRRNYGCSHFVVGRDHAGVGDYYGTYDAQEIFEEVDGEALGIVPLKFEHAFWCGVTGQMATAKTSPAGPEDRLFLSGTKVREMLRNGESLPEEFSRPEVAAILERAYRAEGAGAEGAGAEEAGAEEAEAPV